MLSRPTIESEFLDADDHRVSSRAERANRHGNATPILTLRFAATLTSLTGLACLFWIPTAYEITQGLNPDVIDYQNLFGTIAAVPFWCSITIWLLQKSKASNPATTK